LKNRKLFAILTLVAFMMTLLPMAAFAAPAGNIYASTFTTDKESAAVSDNTGGVKLIVNSANSVAGTVYALGSQNVILVTNRVGTTDNIEVWSGTAKGTVVTAGTEFQTAGAGANEGLLEARLYTAIPGTVKVVAALRDTAFGTVAAQATALQNYLNGSDANTASALGVIAQKTVTFTSATTGNVVLSVDPGSTTANGLAQKTIVATVRSGSGVGLGSPVVGEEVTFTVNKTGLDFDKVTYVTDSLGRATAKISSTKSGTYEVTAQAGGEVSTPVNYVFAADATPYNLTIVKQPSDVLATGAVATNVIKLKVTDLNGNRRSVHGEVTTVKVESSPADSSAADPATNGLDAENNLQYNFRPDKEGSYVLRFALANGKFVDVPVEAAKQGKVASLTIKYDEKSITIPSAAPGAWSTAPTVKQLDAASVSRTAAGSLQFSSSNPSILEVNSGNGQVRVVTADSKDAQVVTITVVDTTNNLVASTEMPVVGAPVAIEVTGDGVAETNAKANFDVRFIDKNGNTVALGANPTLYAHTVVSKPAGAGIDVSYAGTKDADFNETGKSSVSITSTKAGVVEVLLRITAGGQVYVGTAKVNVGVPASEKPSYGAKNVTMFIGSAGFVKDGSAMTMDQSPFIQDGRTFVPVRMVGEALGAEVEFDAATQVITLTRADMTITMTVGSNVLTKSDGTTVVADVAPFIVAETGRTVIPFRAIAEAFGATVEAVFAADGTVNAVTFAQ